jgi:hypothetical protein
VDKQTEAIAAMAGFVRGSFGAALVLISPCVRADEIRAFAPPYEFALKEPADPPASGGPATYATTGAYPAWGIAAWNIPGDRLPPFTVRRDRGRSVFETANRVASVKVIQEDGKARYTLAQNGAHLPCEGANGRAREFDLFVASEGPALATQLPALGGMKALIQTVKLAVHTETPATSNGCAVSQGAAMLALVMDNEVSRQTLFYQLRLNLFCGQGTKDWARTCRGTVVSPELTFFSAKNPFGIDDYLPLTGNGWLQDDRSYALRLDFLPRLLAALRQAPPGLDRNPDHWRLTRAYHGQHIWGDVSMRSEWSDLDLKVNR